MKRSVISPKDFFGFTPGDEGKMLDYEPLISYFKQLSKYSKKINKIQD